MKYNKETYKNKNLIRVSRKKVNNIINNPSKYKGLVIYMLPVNANPHSIFMYFFELEIEDIIYMDSIDYNRYIAECEYYNCNNEHRFKDLSIDIVKYKDVENDPYNKDRMFILQVKNFIDRFKNNHFCESLIDPEEKDNYIILNESYNINKTEMRKIQRLINGKSIFTSEENSKAISLTGKSGYAWLLACKRF